MEIAQFIIHETGNIMTRAIVVGANSSIAQSVIEQLLSGQVVEQVTAISRDTNSQLQEKFGSSLRWVCCDYSEEAMKEAPITPAHKKCLG